MGKHTIIMTLHPMMPVTVALFPLQLSEQKAATLSLLVCYNLNICCFPGQNGL